MTPTTFEEARTELDALLEALESDQAGVEELLVKVRRARELIDFCRRRLREVEDQTEELLRNEPDDEA